MAIAGSKGSNVNMG